MCLAAHTSGRTFSPAVAGRSSMVAIQREAAQGTQTMRPPRRWASSQPRKTECTLVRTCPPRALVSTQGCLWRAGKRCSALAATLYVCSRRRPSTRACLSSVSITSPRAAVCGPPSGWTALTARIHGHLGESSTSWRAPTARRPLCQRCTPHSSATCLQPRRGSTSPAPGQEGVWASWLTTAAFTTTLPSMGRAVPRRDLKAPWAAASMLVAEAPSPWNGTQRPGTSVFGSGRGPRSPRTWCTRLPIREAGANPTPSFRCATSPARPAASKSFAS
mmetsp:Transcript_44116/g.96040  ORF Transcript_44116/g.96040 Transcript_44116/m.96040 type:complete len:275 (+) Transcript_44116:101-925(+)